MNDIVCSKSGNDTPKGGLGQCMNMHAFPKRGPARRLQVAILAGFLGACGNSQMEWNEQVVLQGGDIIVVKRTAKFSENSIAGGGGGSFNKGMTLQIVQPAAADNPGPWDARFVPIILDRDPKTKEWFIVATFFHCDSWFELGRPKLPYTEYRFLNGNWVQRALTETLIGREANVLPADPSDRTAISESKPALTAERKMRILNNPAIAPEFKKVVDKWQSGGNC